MRSPGYRSVRLPAKEAKRTRLFLLLLLLRALDLAPRALVGSQVVVQRPHDVEEQRHRDSNARDDAARHDRRAVLVLRIGRLDGLHRREVERELVRRVPHAERVGVDAALLLRRDVEAVLPLRLLLVVVLLVRFHAETLTFPGSGCGAAW